MASGPNSATVIWLRAGALLLVLGTMGGAGAQTPGASLIYSCTDPSGKRITRDRYIAECSAREQRVLNADGSLRQILPPTMTSDERGDADARARDAEARRIEQRDAIKRDRNLLVRFPNEAAHRKARETALDDVRKSLAVSDQRLITLAKERKPLNDESEFYIGKQLPLKLRLAIDANDAAVDAQRTLQQNQQTEIQRINKLYDDELERLRQLWSGAPMGATPGGGAPRR